jgi:GNAT superfamily N-acetyltransferase
MARLRDQLDTPAGPVTLRARTPADALIVQRIYRSTREAELAVTSWSDEQKDAFARIQLEAQDTDYRRRFPGLDQRLIELDGELIGRLTVHRGLGEVRLVDVAVLPAHQRRGVGTAAVAATTALADEIGVPTRLHVEPASPARRLYERLGFVAGALSDGEIPRIAMERAPAPRSPAP